MCCSRSSSPADMLIQLDEKCVLCNSKNSLTSVTEVDVQVNTSLFYGASTVVHGELKIGILNR